MKNRTLLGVVFLMIASVLVVRILFHKKTKQFEVELYKYEVTQFDALKTRKEQKLVELNLSHAKIKDLFIESYDEGSSIIIRDTSFSFLYLKKDYKFNYPSPIYIDCLHQYCIEVIENDRINSIILANELSLKQKYSEAFNKWYPTLKDKWLIKVSKPYNACSKFFPDHSLVVYDQNTMNEFERLLVVYTNDLKDGHLSTSQSLITFDSRTQLTKNQLRPSAVAFFDTNISKERNRILLKTPYTKVFNSHLLGILEYEITKTTFNQDAFQSVVDAAYKEQWKSNSLNSGSMPYANCFGSSNSCNGNNCSQIKVITSGRGDVVVTIKNRDFRVVRHAYIKGGRSFTFDLPDGRYQVFFYSGVGWDPTKPISSSSCNTLRGGFVAEESFTKDNYETLSGHILTYELKLQSHGNFSPKQSSEKEAF